MASHTKGPLLLEFRAGMVFLAGDGGCPLISSMPNKSRGGDHTTGAAQWSRDAMERIVECVNYCAAVDTGSLAALRAQRDELQERITQLQEEVAARVPISEVDGLTDKERELAAALTRCCHTMAHAKNCEKRAEQGPEACTCGVSSAYDAARVALAKVSS